MGEHGGSLPPETFAVLLVCFTYPPVLGGSEIEAQRVCRALRQRGHDVTVLCAHHPGMPEAGTWLDEYGTPVRSSGRGWSETWRGRAFAWSVAGHLWRVRRRVQVVYFLMQGLHLATGLPICRLLGLPVVMKISGSGLISLMRESWLGRLELRWLNDWARRVMILNEGMRDEALTSGLAARKLLWMPNPVDTSEFAPPEAAEKERLRAAAGFGPGDIVIVYVGRLAPEKELFTLLEAFAKTVSQRPRAKLLLVGDGPERSRLEQRILDLGLTHAVRFAGRQTAAGVRELLRSADIFALVSRLEGFPCSLIEAMATGLPSVVSGIPANLQLVGDGEQGWSSAVGDVPGLAAAMTRLIDSPADRFRMGQEARRRIVENYSTEKIALRYEELFAEARRSAP